jgi:hypothetical protein
LSPVTSPAAVWVAESGSDAFALGFPLQAVTVNATVSPAAANDLRYSSFISRMLKLVYGVRSQKAADVPRCGAVRAASAVWTIVVRERQRTIPIRTVGVSLRGSVADG